MISKDVVCPYCEETHIYDAKGVNTKRLTLRCRHCHKKFRVAWMNDFVSTYKREDEERNGKIDIKESPKKIDKPEFLEVKCFFVMRP